MIAGRGARVILTDEGRSAYVWDVPLPDRYLVPDHGGIGYLSGVRPRGYWRPESDDYETMTCTDLLPFIMRWWWRRRWACALNDYGWRCAPRVGRFWFDRATRARDLRGVRMCVVETARPGTSETTTGDTIL